MSVSSILEVPQNIALALSMASTATGADYNYLLQTAYRESKFEAQARARTSSAVGLFQFIEETWLRTIKSEGEKFGLGQYADRIFKTRTGRHYVPEAEERREILALRRDPKIASLMAGVFARNNADRLAQEIGRKATAGELYLAHFLGATNAVRLIKLALSNPNKKAAREFPAAAKANKRIFYDGKRARSTRQVYLNLVRRHNRAQKAQVHVRRLTSKRAVKKGTPLTKRSLKSGVSVYALKAGMGEAGRQRKARYQARKWSTFIRHSAGKAVNLRGAIIDSHGSRTMVKKVSRSKAGNGQ